MYCCLRWDMMYSASRTDLRNIAQWLRGHDDSQWENQIGLLSDTISDLENSAKPKTPQWGPLPLQCPG